MAIKTIFAETTLEGFSLSEIYGYFFKSVSPAPFSLAPGETYTVVWGPDTFEVTAQDSSAIIPGTTFIGNGANYGFPSNDEPFAIVCSASDVTFFAVTDTEPNDHTIAIYHGTEDDTGADPEDPPEGIVLKDRNGKDVAYYGIETVTFDTTTEGKQQVFTKGVVAPKMEIPVTFADGDMLITADKNTLIKELVLQKPDTAIPENIRKDVNMCGLTGTFIGDTEEITVDLNMADGDQIIVPSAPGKVISMVTVKKPETLVPENVAEGIDIARIIGTLVAGGSNVKIDYGTFTGNNGNVTVSHGLGVIPDVVFVFTTGVPSSTTISALRFAAGFSQGIIDLLTALGANLGQIYMATKKSGNYQTGNLSTSNKLNPIVNTSSAVVIHNATEINFIVGHHDVSVGVYQTGLDLTYTWIAIGGLTE